MKNLKLLKVKKLLLTAIAIGVAGYLLNYYIALPICARYSKPVTMYMEWNEKQIAAGSPKRITFRIPYAYLLPHDTPFGSGIGPQSVIGFSFDKDTGKPACLLETSDRFEREANQGSFIFVSVHPSLPKMPENSRVSGCTRYPQIESGYEGFNAYRSSDRSTCYVPENPPSNLSHFDCLNGDEKIRGCRASVFYKSLRIEYSFRRNKMAEWATIQDKVLEKIDSYISDIDE